MALIFNLMQRPVEESVVRPRSNALRPHVTFAGDWKSQNTESECSCACQASVSWTGRRMNLKNAKRRSAPRMVKHRACV